MSGLTKVLRFGALQLLGALSLLFLTLDTPAMTASPSPSYDGNYTVRWDSTLGCTYNDDPPFYSYQCYSLLENGVEIGASGYSLQVTGKPEGSYDYYVYYTFYVYGQLYDAYGVESASVIVGTPPPRDSIPTQLTYQFQTRQGDINYDGRTDLFVQRSSGGVAGNGVLDSVILRQNASGGTFSPVVPDAYSSGIASGWPLSSATPVITDFNVDGYVDVEVKGVGVATGTSADDQIVFSSGVPLQPQPLGLRAVDASLKQFVGNSLDYLANSDYFHENAPLHYFTGTMIYFDCEFAGYGFYEGVISGLYGNWPCTVYYYTVSGTYSDYTGFSERAVALWSYEDAYDHGGVGAIESTEGAQEAVEDVLDVAIGGWPMEEELGPSGEHHTDPNWRRGLETFWAILGVAQKNADEIETEEAPKQSPPEPSVCVTLNARHVIGLGSTSQHASVVYQPLVQWIGAYDSDDSTFGNGNLVSEPNDARDNPRLTKIVSTVTLPGGMPCMAYWGAVTVADGHYGDDLPYHPTPNVIPGAYNSNGYAHGLLNATGGSATVGTGDRLWGWDKPVPNSEF